MKLESTLPERPGVLFVVPAFNLFALLLVFFLLGPSFVSQSGVAVELPVSRFQMERQADATVVTSYSLPCWSGPQRCHPRRAHLGKQDEQPLASS